MEISRFLQSYMEECFLKSCQYVQAEMDTYADKTWKELRDTIYGILLEAGILQKQNKKGDIQYLAFHFMQYGMYMDKLEMRIEVLDDRFYLDEEEAAGYYRPAFLLNRYLADLDFLYRKAGESFIRLQDYELEKVKEEYANFFSAILFQMMKGLSGLIMELVKESGIRITDRFMMIYGEYMECAVILCEEGG